MRIDLCVNKIITHSFLSAFISIIDRKFPISISISYVMFVISISITDTLLDGIKAY